ncbi:MAG: AMP-binding protein [Candidatus Cloacimonetes bacterium]|nr:AMP-binding protein [Candidatus Cloacimonadota bacterium]
MSTNNFDTFLCSFENDSSLFLSYRQSSQIHNISKHDFFNYVKNIGFQLKDLPKETLVLISLEHSLELFVSFFACLSQNLIPAIIAHPSSKVKNSDFLHKVKSLTKLHKPSAILSVDHTIQLLQDIKNIQCIIPNLKQTGHSSFKLPKNPEFAQFSSGSTGLPKAIKYNFSQLNLHFDDFKKSLQLKPSSKFISWLPLYHDMGLIACFLFPIINDIPIHLISPFLWVNNPEVLFEDIQALKSTHTWMPNFAFKHLSTKVSDTKYNLSSMQSFASCAEPVEPDVMIEFHNRFCDYQLSSSSFAISYAMAENIFAMSHHTFDIQSNDWFIQVDQKDFRQGKIKIDPNSNKKIASCGPPLTNTKITFEQKYPQISNLYIESPYMVDHYWNQDQSLLSNNRFNTKDLGFLYQNQVYICGRNSDLIISRGINIFPQEVEDFVSSIPNVYPGRVVCIGNFDPQIGTERIILLFETKELLKNDFKELESQVSRLVFQERGIVIDEICAYPHQTLLKTSSGKIARQPNLEAYLENKIKNIHIMGCSHIYAFNKSNQLYNQDSCAANIFLKQIPVVSAQNIDLSPRKEEISEYISKLSPSSIVLFYIGEQDIRTFIPYLLRNFNMPIDHVIDQIMDKYASFLKRVNLLRSDLQYGWIIPPPPGKGLAPHPRFVNKKRLSNDCYYHFLDTELHRKSYAKKFYQGLKKLDVKLIDIWPSILDNVDTLKIKKQYILDYSHLKDVKPLLEDQIKTIFQTSILDTKVSPKYSKTILVVENVEFEIKSLILKKFGHKIDLNTDILSLFNSLHIVELVQEISTHYEVTIPNNWMDKSEIETLPKLCDFLLKHRNKET